MIFENKVVLVTGGSAGIGASTAIHFAKEGAKVAIVGRNENKLKSVSQQCAKLSTDCLIITADVAKDESAKIIIDKTIEKFGRLDILVNNAGILREGSILNGKLLDTYDEVMNTNLRSIVRLTCEAAPYLIKTKGNIINVSSIASKRARSPLYLAYSTSKAGLDVFTRGTALELAPHGVRVNSVNPGPVRTDIFEAGGITVNADNLASGTALGRVSDPVEISDLILYLAGPKARGITGSIYMCDNGFLLTHP